MKRIPSLNLSHASSSFDNFSFLSMPYDSYQTDVFSLTLVCCTVNVVRELRVLCAAVGVE